LELLAESPRFTRYRRAFLLLFFGAGGRRGISPTGLVRIPAIGTFS